jgi:hypothetical protein
MDLKALEDLLVLLKKYGVGHFADGKVSIGFIVEDDEAVATVPQPEATDMPAASEFVYEDPEADNDPFAHLDPRVRSAIPAEMLHPALWQGRK